MANKGNLRAWARYDGSGTLIPGSNILQRIKPKVGNWRELVAYECCSGFNIYVCGAGTTGVNGLYTYAGIRNGKPYYIKGTYILSWGEYPGIDDWEIYDSELVNTWYYYADDDVATPNLTGEWIVDDGELPVPSIGTSACTTTTTTLLR